MSIPESDARAKWQEAWRQLPRAERGGARQAFAFITEREQDLPTDWQGRDGEPWTTIHSWLKEADQKDGIEWRLL